MLAVHLQAVHLVLASQKASQAPSAAARSAAAMDFALNILSAWTWSRGAGACHW